MRDIGAKATKRFTFYSKNSGNKLAPAKTWEVPNEYPTKVTQSYPVFAIM